MHQKGLKVMYQTRQFSELFSLKNAAVKSPNLLKIMILKKYYFLKRCKSMVSEIVLSFSGFRVYIQSKINTMIRTKHLLTTTVTARITAEQKQKIEKYAKEMKITKSGFVRNFITESLSNLK